MAYYQVHLQEFHLDQYSLGAISVGRHQKLADCLPVFQVLKKASLMENAAATSRINY